ARAEKHPQRVREDKADQQWITVTAKEGQHELGGPFSLLRKHLYFHSRSPRGSRMLPEAGWPPAATGTRLADTHDELRIRRPTLLLLPLHLRRRPGLHPAVRTGEPRVQCTPHAHGEGRGRPGERAGDLPGRVPPGLCPAPRRPPAAGGW